MKRRRMNAQHEAVVLRPRHHNPAPPEDGGAAAAAAARTSDARGMSVGDADEKSSAGSGAPGAPGGRPPTPPPGIGCASASAQMRGPDTSRGSSENGGRRASQGGSANAAARPEATGAERANWGAKTGCDSNAYTSVAKKTIFAKFSPAGFRLLKFFFFAATCAFCSRRGVFIVTQPFRISPLRLSKNTPVSLSLNVAACAAND